MLALRARQRELEYVIEAIEDGDSTRVNTPEGIVRIFEAYYAALYADDPTVRYNGYETKVLAYADNAALLTPDPQPALQELE
ncbi:hypothetical protein NDU88_002482 [Pleurodeles waltl]|uniref:Reverse transcriptase n=1 Tax=Pleurodeles waltl TaxID=8319 RepID=A0AAV7LCG1_PLEWA|nr:hypothetical protein NDU88_002482 [Pleurodeles waltl]